MHNPGVGPGAKPSSSPNNSLFWVGWDCSETTVLLGLCAAYLEEGVWTDRPLSPSAPHLGLSQVSFQMG
jgi:hypothetical protein